jgi:hypothetical protein
MIPAVLEDTPEVAHRAIMDDPLAVLAAASYWQQQCRADSRCPAGLYWEEQRCPDSSIKTILCMHQHVASVAVDSIKKVRR